MKKIFLYVGVLTLFFSCKKDENSDPVPQPDPSKPKTIYVATQANNSDIYRIVNANLNPQVELFIDSNEPAGVVTAIELDKAGGKIYWVWSGLVNGTNGIYRANISGQNVGVPELIKATTEGNRIALDLLSNPKKIYWTTTGAASRHIIKRSNLDGTMEENFLTGTPNQDRFMALTVDQPDNKLYFGRNQGGVSSIVGTAPLNQQGAPNFNLITINDFNLMPGNTIEMTNNKLYWNSNVLSEIATHNKDGSGNTQVIFPGTPFWDGFYLDVATQKIYGFTGINDRLSIYNADGTGNPEPINAVLPEADHVMLTLEY